jgi:hypothetical protein
VFLQGNKRAALSVFLVLKALDITILSSSKIVCNLCGDKILTTTGFVQ